MTICNPFSNAKDDIGFMRRPPKNVAVALVTLLEMQEVEQDPLSDINPSNIATFLIIVKVPVEYIGMTPNPVAKMVEFVEILPVPETVLNDMNEVCPLIWMTVLITREPSENVNVDVEPNRINAFPPIESVNVVEPPN